MQKSNGSNASTLVVAPRDHFLDNAGMSESDSDQEAIEEGMLIEAPVTPEKSLALPDAEGSCQDSGKANVGGDGSSNGSGKADGVAERSDQGSGEADGMAEGSDPGSEKAGQNGAVDAATAFAVPSTPLVCHTCCKMCALGPTTCFWLCPILNRCIFQSQDVMQVCWPFMLGYSICAQAGHSWWH